MKRLTVVAALAVVVAVFCWRMLRSAATPAGGSPPVGAATATSVESPRETAPPRRRPALDTAPPTDAPEAADESPMETRAYVVRVVAAGSEAPIAGATVRFWKRFLHDDEHAYENFVTDAGGVVKATIQAPDGTIYANVTAPGFVRSGWLGEDPGKDGVTEIVARLQPGVTVWGVVVDARTGAPIAGVRVEAEIGGEDQMHCFGPPDAPLADPVVTGADGAFRFEGVPVKDGAVFEASAPRHASESQKWSKGDPTHTEIRMQPAGTVRGVVRDVAGAPVAEAWVGARTTDGAKWRDAATKADAQGCFELSGLALDRVYEVWTQGDRGASAATSGVRTSAESPIAVVDLTLLPSADLLVRVRGPKGVPIVGSVALRMATIDTYKNSAADGDVVLPVPQPGPCRIEVDADGYLPFKVAIEIALGEHKTLDVVLDVGLAVEGIVVDDLDAPIEGAHVTSTIPGSFLTRPSSSAAGGAFRLTGLTSTPCDLTASAAEHDAATLEEVVAPMSALRFVLRRHGTVALTVRLPEGAPRPDELVLGFDLESSDESSSTTNVRKSLDDGGDLVASVAAGRYSFFVTAAGYAPTKRNFEIKPGERVDLGVVELGRGLVATGRVVDADGHGIAGAHVKAIVIGGDDDPSATTDASGAFRLARFPVGGEYVHATADGFLDSKSVKYDAADGAAPLVITLSRGGRLRGHVVDPEHRIAAKDVCVGVTGPIVGEFEGRHSFLDVDSKFAFATQLAAGRYRVALIGDDDAELAVKDVDVKDGEETSLDLVVVR